MDNIVTPHDFIFKKYLSNKKVAEELIKSYLPDEIVQKIDFSTLALVQGSFIDEKLRHSETDVLYKAKFDGSFAYFYLLFEHQSTPVLKMPLRSAKYLVQIMEHHLEVNKTTKVPYVFPVVFYNGKAKYPYETDIRAMIDAPKELRAEFRLGHFNLVDLNEIDDTSLREMTWAKLLVYAMKHAYSPDPRLVLATIIKQLELFAKYVPEVDLSTMQTPMIYYIINGYRELDRQYFLDMLKDSQSEILREEGMSVADQLRQEGHRMGRQEGRLEGRDELLIRLLDKGFSPYDLSDAAGVSESQIRQLLAQKVE